MLLHPTVTALQVQSAAVGAGVNRAAILSSLFLLNAGEGHTVLIRLDVESICAACGVPVFSLISLHYTTQADVWKHEKRILQKAKLKRNETAAERLMAKTTRCCLK